MNLIVIAARVTRFSKFESSPFKLARNSQKQIWKSKINKNYQIPYVYVRF